MHIVKVVKYLERKAWKTKHFLVGHLKFKIRKTSRYNLCLLSKSQLDTRFLFSKAIKYIVVDVSYKNKSKKCIDVLILFNFQVYTKFH